MSLNWFTVKEVIEEADEELCSKDVWKRAKERKNNMKYSTVKDTLKKLADSRSSGIERRSVSGRGRGGKKFLYSST